MKAKSPRGLVTLLRIRPQILRSVAERPDGLLLHEDIFFSFAPPHFGMRQYWRDFDGFWHELYSRAGAMEGAYLDMDPVGLMRIAPVIPGRGQMFSARGRLGRGGVEKIGSVLTEDAVYKA